MNKLASEKQHLIDAWEKSDAVTNKAIINAFKKVPREFFVLDQFHNFAYLDRPLPIPGGQTISQPTTVITMLDVLDIKPGQKILEIGAGSGYNAALLGTLVGDTGTVISTEIIPELATFAQENLIKAGITNVKVLEIDGSKGYPLEAPYDRIIVTAAAPQIPQVLVDQLQENGILLIPVGKGDTQTMIRAHKINNKLELEDLGTYLFVPLTGEYGKKKL